ncbi:MAG: hypothetical protein ONB48_13695 [candidate division KSB1 bacterium]|nr:hypothetical protein [candidate division KSB1 bacterium]MDZ7276516.1 hypothetical protein [candidate division KSB1 bacterium]MDZ7286703.1 hypothetical protein [candidate division KSB1 bacterium]MDZ7300286.1 hypothetical protein [candidate division KSB1 bacterium]MDZ7307887.1 hypothetical protein [candidate division KSB1 bacterium]
MKLKPVRAAALLLAVLVAGCNIFSPFKPGEQNDDPEALLAQAQAELRNNNPQQALALLERAKQQSPQTPLIRYYHAVATIRAYNVNFDTFITALQSGTAAPAADKQRGNLIAAVNDTLPLFDFSEAELARLLAVFHAVRDDLEPVVTGLINGTIRPGDFPFANDAYLSCGVASLVYGFVLMLDQDHNYATGFQLDPRLSINMAAGLYQVVIEDPQKTAQQICREVESVIRTTYPLLEQGLVCLWYYYNDATFGRLPVTPAPVPPAALPGNLRNTPAGRFFRVVFEGLSALYGFKC